VPSIVRTQPVALYYQIQQDLRARIKRGEWKAGDRLPPEPELAARYRVSRITIRQALAGLVADGLIDRRQGTGTFVRAEKVAQRTGILTSFTEEMEHRGLDPVTRILDFQIRTPSEDVQKILRLSASDPIAYLKRLRIANGEPLAFTEASLPARLVPDLQHTPLVNGSLYRTLEEVYGLELAQADEEIEAVRATAEERRLLGVKPGAPMFQITRTTYLATGEPVEFARVAYKADRFKYYLRLKGRR
jgi:GntR family transcriptional regulator